MLEFGVVCVEMVKTLGDGDKETAGEADGKLRGGDSTLEASP